MPEASYDPVRLGYHGWKKRLVGPIERFFLRRADVVVATCEAEAEWIRAYEPRVKSIEVVDVKRFFRIENGELRIENERGLHLLYLGRRHPLKGVEYLESAVEKVVSGRRESAVERQGLPVELRIVSDAFGEEKERVWEWCDVLVLPTLSENFGLVVAEALERGKRVITTDGAPAWESGLGVKVESEKLRAGCFEGCEIRAGFGGRLTYLKGYRGGTRDVRVKLLKTAIENMLA